MDISNQELQTLTLSWCNDIVRDAIRKAQGMSLHNSHFEIPRVERLLGGITQDSNGCVIARTLSEALGSSSSVSQQTLIWMRGRHDEPWMWHHPTYINEFINRFDQKTMPELDVHNPIYNQIEQDRLRRETRYKEWQQDTRQMINAYAGCPVIKTACDIPVEPLHHIDWNKEMGFEGVAAPETA